MKQVEYNFRVEVIRNGQKRAYADTFREYKVTSDQPKEVIIEFCKHVLCKSFDKKDMPNAFAPECLKLEVCETFSQLTTVHYLVRELFTD